MDETLDFEIPKSKVYILVDPNTNHIIRIEGQYSLPSDLTDWILLDEGYGDKYNHAQGNYLEKPLIDMDGTHNYKYIDGKVVETTEEEKQNELTSIVSNEPVTDMERVEAQVLYTALMTDTLLESEE